MRYRYAQIQNLGAQIMRFCKSDIHLFQAIAEGETRICKPVVLRVCRSINLEGIYCIGLYEDLDDYHLIKLSRSEIWTKPELLATIIHEYIHAWQSENDLPINHSRSGDFPYWRRRIKRAYNLDISNINQ